MDNHIDIYCERVGPTFWAEPLNAVSNASFLIAAIAAMYLVWRQHAAVKKVGNDHPMPLDSLFLAGMIGIIGVGSFLFHTFANHITLLADVIPIAIYQLSFLSLYGRRIMGLSYSRVTMMMIGFVMLGQSSYMVKDVLNGSLGYAPALLFLLAYATYHYVTAKTERLILFLAAGIFTVSLTFRSVDMAICDDLPIGIHYMWHILNAVVLYLTTRAYVMNRPIGSPL